MAQIITVDFPARKVTDWGLVGFAEAARRTEAEALRHSGEIARTLERVAARYRKAAERGGS